MNDSATEHRSTGQPTLDSSSIYIKDAYRAIFPEIFVPGVCNEDRKKSVCLATFSPPSTQVKWTICRHRNKTVILSEPWNSGRLQIGHLFATGKDIMSSYSRKRSNKQVTSTYETSGLVMLQVLSKYRSVAFQNSLTAL